jgi:DNA-directed RNA polymerase subunit RPC12/RpoP
MTTQTWTPHPEANIKKCRNCGAEFVKSRTDSTVNCPDCRGGRRRSATRPSRSRQIQAIKVVEEYVTTRDFDGDGDTTPVIAQAYHPDKGWKTYPMRKRISVAWAIKMRAEGYTTVGLAVFPNRVADFSLKELVREYSMFEWAAHERAMREARRRNREYQS